MTDPLMIPLLAASIIAIAKFTKNEGLFIKFFNGVTKKELDEEVNQKVIDSLLSQDFVTYDSLNEALEGKLSALSSSQDSIGIKSGKKTFTQLME